MVFFCERKCLFYLVFFPINFGHVTFGWWRLFVSFSGFSPINFHFYLSIIFDNKQDDKNKSNLMTILPSLSIRRNSSLLSIVVKKKSPSNQDSNYSLILLLKDCNKYSDENLSLAFVGDLFCIDLGCERFNECVGELLCS